MKNVLKPFLFLCAAVGFAVTSFAQNRTTSLFTMNASTAASNANIVVYSNSFESSQDTVGWRGYGMGLFDSDAAPDGGQRSLHVCGGCIWPHAMFELPANVEDGYFQLRCWGKDLQIGGGVTLSVEGDHFGSQITVNEKQWTPYHGTDTVYCPAGKRLVLSLGAGGIAPSAMLVDRLEILRVNVVTSAPDDKGSGLPKTFVVFQNFPNPFNPATRIRYEIPVGGRVLVEIFDRMGRKLSTLVERTQPAGRYEVEWNASQLASGAYFCRIQSGPSSQTRKLLLLK